MKKAITKKSALFAFTVLMSILLVSGCACLNYRPVPIKNAAVGLNFSTGGKVDFIDQNGKPIPSASFRDQLELIREKAPKWEIQKVQTINVYHIEGSHYIVFEIDGEGICLEYTDAWEYVGPC